MTKWTVLNEVDDRIRETEEKLGTLRAMRSEIVGDFGPPEIHYPALIEESKANTTDWIVGGLIPSQSIGVLCAEPRIGKSTLAMQFGLALGKGWNIFGMRVPKARKVLYLFAEGARGLVGARVKSCAEKMNLSDPANLWVQSRNYTEFSARGSALRTMVADGKFDLVVLDTLSIFWQGDENSQEDWKRNVLIPLRRMAEDFGPSFLLIHHQTKASPDRQGWQKLRGTGAIFADVDWFLRLEPDDAQPADPMVRRLIVDKSKYGQDNFIIRLKFHKADAYFEMA